MKPISAQPRIHLDVSREKRPSYRKIMVKNDRFLPLFL